MTKWSEEGSPLAPVRHLKKVQKELFNRFLSRASSRPRRGRPRGHSGQPPKQTVHKLRFKGWRALGRWEQWNEIGDLLQENEAKNHPKRENAVGSQSACVVHISYFPVNFRVFGQAEVEDQLIVQKGRAKTFVPVRRKKKASYVSTGTEKIFNKIRSQQHGVASPECKVKIEQPSEYQMSGLEKACGSLREEYKRNTEFSNGWAPVAIADGLLGPAERPFISPFLEKRWRRHRSKRKSDSKRPAAASQYLKHFPEPLTTTIKKLKCPKFTANLNTRALLSRSAQK